MGDSKPIEISSGTIFRILAVVLFVFVFIAVWEILASVFLAIVITAAIEPTIRWLEKHSIHRYISVPFLYVLSITALLGIFYAILPSLFGEVRRLSLIFPQKYEAFLQSIGGNTLGNIGFLGPALDQFFISFQEQLGALAPDLFTFVSQLFGGVIAFALVLVISFYLSLQRDGVERFLVSITPVAHREYVGDFWRRVQRRMGRWLQAQFVLGVFMGISVFILLSLMNVEYALTFAILAGILEVVPIIGPIVVGGLMFLIISVESVVLALVVIGGYFLLQQLEQHLVLPTFMSRIVGMNPVLILISIFVGAELLGIWGLLLAIPMLTIVGEFFRDLQKSPK